MKVFLFLVSLLFCSLASLGSNTTTVPVTFIPIADDPENPPGSICVCPAAVESEQVETVTSQCPSSSSSDLINFEEKLEEAVVTLRMGDVESANYYFAKIDEAPEVVVYLQRIIRENYKDGFNTTMDFISSIFAPSLRLKGYEILLGNLLSQDVAASKTRQDLFRLALTLKSQGENDIYGEEEEIQIFMNLTTKFPQGIRTTVFYPYFAIKNIHDSYVFQYKLIDGDYWGFTGKCHKINCNKSHLVAQPNEDFSLFTIKNGELLGGNNCLGVKANMTIFWVQDDVQRHCPYEKWHIKFVGKTLTMLIYQPQISRSNVTTFDMRDTFKGFAMTRMGFNQRTGLEATTFLNSYQIWWTT